ncbi:hypothetical protein T190607A02C_30161 [Tenacibaculum sp. 190524A02b]
MSCPEIGLHSNVIKWNDIQRHHHLSGKIDIVKNLKDLFVMSF